MVAVNVMDTGGELIFRTRLAIILLFVSRAFFGFGFMHDPAIDAFIKKAASVGSLGEHFLAVLQEEARGILTRISREGSGRQGANSGDG